MGLDIYHQRVVEGDGEKLILSVNGEVEYDSSRILEKQFEVFVQQGEEQFVNLTKTLTNIVGMDSAYNHAKSLKPCSNMVISTGLVIDMHDEILSLRKRVAELENNHEKAYEKWQAKYQQLKDGMALHECYQCGTLVHELSPRSRCCMCEYDRANFNEEENNQLRGQEND